MRQRDQQIACRPGHAGLESRHAPANQAKPLRARPNPRLTECILTPEHITPRKNYMKTSLLAVLVLSVFCIGAQTDPAQITWQPAPHKGGDIATDSDWLILPATNIYEVVTSQMSNSSIRDLPASGLKEFSEANAKRATGHYYSCAQGYRPFLVRAVYDSSFGRFRAERSGNSLAVIWESLPGLSHGALKQSAVS